MTGRVLPITIEELQSRLDGAGPPTADDVSVTADGRRLDTKDAVLAWLAEFDASATEGFGVRSDGGTA